MILKQARNHRLIALIFSLIITLPIFANNEWYGMWQSKPMTLDNETLTMEYDFKNDSSLTMGLVSDSQIPKIGNCVFRITVEGSYFKIGPMFFVKLDLMTMKVKIIKSQVYHNRSTLRGLQEDIKKYAKEIFASFGDNYQMIYVTHKESSNISFVYGDENNSMEVEFHRPRQNAEQLESIEEEKGNSKEEVIPKKDNVRTLPAPIRLFINLSIFILYIIIAFFIIYLIKFLFVRNITRGNAVDKSVRVRRLYYIVRCIVRIIIVIIGLIIWIPLLKDAIEVNRYVVIVVLCGGGGLILLLLSNLSLPLNFTTMPKFLKKKRRFILYLRGFVTDDYSPKMEDIATQICETRPWNVKIRNNEKSVTPNSMPLSERDLAKAWKKYINVYSVGYLKN